jgi:hypothetical protein
MFAREVEKWRHDELGRVNRNQSAWSHCGVLVAAEILNNIHTPAACWSVFETPSHNVENLSAIETSRAELRRGHFDQLPATTFELTADAWLAYVAVEDAIRNNRRALAVEVIDPYEPFDCDHIAEAPYLIPMGDVTRLKFAFSLDLKRTGIWFVEALD